MNRIGRGALIALGAGMLAAASAASQTATINFAGKYEGNTDGGSASATVTPNGKPNQYRVSVEVFGEGGCGGIAKGSATAKGNVLTMTTLVPNIGVCRMTFTKNGNAYRVVGCSELSGRSCNFDGTYTRQGGTRR